MADGAARRPGILARLRAATAGGPLGNRSFQLLSVGQLASTIGDLCYAVALQWFVLSGHGGPRTVLIPVGGVLVDRWGQRAVMLIADAARCVLVTVLVVVAIRHTASLAVLGPIAAVIGAGEGLFLPAQFTIIPSIVEPEQRLVARVRVGGPVARVRWVAGRVRMGGASGGDHPDRDGLEAVGEVGPDPARLPGQLEPGHSPGQRGEHDPDLEPGQVDAQA